jgi:hypothetical protein
MPDEPPADARRAIPYATSHTSSAGTLTVRERLTPAVLSIFWGGTAAVISLNVRSLSHTVRALGALLGLTLIAAGTRRLLRRPPRLIVDDTGILVTRPTEVHIPWSHLLDASVPILHGSTYLLLICEPAPASLGSSPADASPLRRLNSDNVLIPMGGLNITAEELAEEINSRRRRYTSS